jgi:hypothetical protein
VLPAKWSKLRKPGPTVDPLVSLLSLLHALTRPTVAGSAGANTQIHAVIESSGATAAGLPAGSGEAQVLLTLDSRRHVTAVAVTTTVTRPTGGPVRISVITRYGSFNTVKPIKSPV